jgi:hypothetical protein
VERATARLRVAREAHARLRVARAAHARARARSVHGRRRPPAPEKPCVCRVSTSKSTSGATGLLRSTDLKIWRREASSGSGM